MAFPTILVDSGSGSDTTASGAGPASPLSGSLATYTGGTSDVDLSLDAPDLSGVATDGTACLYVVTGSTGSGNKRFYKITAVNNSTKVVTVTGTLPTFVGAAAWAIGGKRASLNDGGTRLLFDNAGSLGDAKAGWTVQLMSGHAETLNDRLLFRINGSTTDGPFILRGEPNAGTMPVLTWSTEDIALFTLGDYAHIFDIHFKNTSGAKNASEAIRFQNSAGGIVRGCVFGTIGSIADYWFRGINITGECNLIEGCYFNGGDAHVRCASGGAFGITIRNNYFTNASIAVDGNVSGSSILFVSLVGNVFDDTGVGARFTASTSVSSRSIFAQNTFDNCGYGLFIDGTSAGWGVAIIENNIFSNSTTVGLQIDDMTAEQMAAYGVTIRGNNYHNNADDFYPVPLAQTDDLYLDPQYTDAAGEDFSIGTNLKAKGIPIGGEKPVGAVSATYSYLDIGAAQRQESGGGGGRNGILTGGAL